MEVDERMTLQMSEGILNTEREHAIALEYEVLQNKNMIDEIHLTKTL